MSLDIKSLYIFNYLGTHNYHVFLNIQKYDYCNYKFINTNVFVWIITQILETYIQLEMHIYISIYRCKEITSLLVIFNYKYISCKKERDSLLVVQKMLIDMPYPLTPTPILWNRFPTYHHSTSEFARREDNRRKG